MNYAGGGVDGVLNGHVVTAPSYTGAGGAPNTWTLSTNSNFYTATQATTTDPLGHVWTMNLDSNGNVTGTIDPLTNQWQFQYNANGSELTKVIDPTAVATTFNYGESGAPASRLTSIKDAGNVVRAVFAYDTTYGQLVSSKIPALASASGFDEITQFAYDAVKGDLISITDPRGDMVKVNAYDALGDPLSVSVYPDTGNPTTSLTPLTTTIDYNAAQMPTLITDPTGTSLQTAFDNGIMSQFKLVNQGATLAQMDLFRDTRGRIYKFTDLKGTLAQFRFDKNSNVTKVIDGNGNITTTTYGAVNEPIGRTWPDNKSISLLYDAKGRVRQVTDERNVVVNYSYDNANRLRDVQLPAHPTQNVHLDFDAAGRPTFVSDISGSTTFNYDATRKRLTGKTTVLSALASGSNSFPITYSYYADGKCSGMTLQIGATSYTTTYAYYKSGRLTSMTNPFGDVTTWTHDRAGRLTNQTTTPSGGVPISTTYGYGVSGMTGDPSTSPFYLRTIMQTTNGLPFWNYTLKHSYLGQLLEQGATGVNSTVETQAFTYDTRGRLATEGQIYTVGASSATQTGDYQYDLANNLQGVAGRWSYNANNQVTAAPSGNGLAGMTGLTYDFAGNLIGANGSALSYDPFGRLTSAGIATYAYNAFGQRIKKTVGSASTYFVYAGNRLLAELDGTGKLVRFYTWGATGLVSDRIPQIVQPEMNRLSGGNAVAAAGGGTTWSSRYYLYDGRGSTRAIVDKNGNLLSRGAYSAWGAPFGGYVPSSPMAWNGRFGGYTDSETGLVCLHHRYYAPNIGRFLSRDPIGFAGGLALYAYCGDDPVNLSDPSGLSPDGTGIVTEEGNLGSDLLASVGNFAKDNFWPPSIYDRLRGSADNFGTVWGEYDSGKASAADVAGAGLRLGTDVVGTAFTVAGVVKFGASGVRAGIQAARGRASRGMILPEKCTTGCFVAGTRVKAAVPDAKSKDGYRVTDTPIEQMQQGQQVVSRDEATGKTSVKRVLHTTKRTVPLVLVVTLSDTAGKVIESITATRNHPFYVRGKGFVPAGGLAVGNSIVTRAGPDVVVSKIEWKRQAGGFVVYNFEVEDSHTYFVGNSGAWVHNPIDCFEDEVAETVKVIGRRVDTAIAEGAPGHDVLNIPNWSLSANDAWVQEGINRGQTFYIASPINMKTLRSTEYGTTVFFRELKMLRNAGYRRVGDYMLPPTP